MITQMAKMLTAVMPTPTPAFSPAEAEDRPKVGEVLETDAEGLDVLDILGVVVAELLVDVVAEIVATEAESVVEAPVVDGGMVLGRLDCSEAGRLE